MMWAALATLIIVLFIAIQWFVGLQKIPLLVKETVPDSKESVSIVVAARNEEKRIFSAVKTMLDLHAEQLEVIVVNDRSTDRTADELRRLQEYDDKARLRVIHIESLPDGWLGKNHALYRGAAAASNKWLLFTDADIYFQPPTLQKAVGWCLEHQLDHLALIPENRGGTSMYRAFHSYWSIIGIWNFIQLKHAGIGAFNMMKKSVYEACGTHRSLRTAPDDDLKLGKRLVRLGFRQQLGLGSGLVSVQWYESIPETVQGLEKNLFAFMRYYFSAVFFFTVLLAFLHIVPFIGVFTIPSAAGYIWGSVLAVYVFMYAWNSRLTGEPALHVLAMPAAAAVFLYSLNRSAYKTWRRGGVEWRGTVYPLSELKRKS